VLKRSERAPFTWVTARRRQPQATNLIVVCFPAPVRWSTFCLQRGIQTSHCQIKPLPSRCNTKVSRKIDSVLLCVLRVLCGSIRRSTKVRRATEQVSRCKCSRVRDWVIRALHRRCRSLWPNAESFPAYFVHLRDYLTGPGVHCLPTIRQLQSARRSIVSRKFRRPIVA
jgi:hypothetical protein